MIIDANSIEDSDILQAEICILGGGVAGIILANELLNSNKSIILLESGGEMYNNKTQELYKAESTPPHFPNPHFSRLRFLGGSSNHWENSIERLSPIDFKKREWVRDSGWPITYDEVARFYPDAEDYCNVGGDGYDFNFWKKKLKSDDAFLASDSFNSVVSKSPLIPTHFYSQHSEKLKNSNNIRIIKNSNIIDLEYDKETQIVQSVTFRTLQNIQKKVYAKKFVMCLGGIENARMLLLFNEKFENTLGNRSDNVGRYFMEHPTIRAAHLLPFYEYYLDKIYYDGTMDKGLHIRARASLSEDAQTKYRTNNLRMYFSKQSKLTLSDGVSSAHIISDSLQSNELPNNFGEHLLNALQDIDHISESLLKQEFDVSLFDDVHRFGGFQIISMIEQTPDRNNRISLGHEKDQLGLKKIKIDFRITQSDKDSAWKTLELFAKDPGIQLLGRVRLLKERENRIWGSQLGFGQHHIGTTRMSHTAEKGVVDSNLKVFGTKNFYISGSSVFPTGGHVPPTLTIIAITIRLAHELRSNV
ncbi:Glucose-methanol-choline (GMC) oxidoreductase:NAD binding site [hydrothermal vent metagenome]|uniref:Glucose-methanol-choline (GMC) oxidoreductase:NAD binding site n=1 Tax=hydrothermal vent metagenome TaxID=652676 RepID=A0A3B0Z178_9ZZZZ